MIDFIDRLDIDYDRFELYDNDFSVVSDVHGVSHVFNVMYNVLLIGYRLDDIRNTKISFCAAYIHDLSRTHDGDCEIHGYVTVRDNFDKYERLFIDSGLTKDDLDCVKIASINHSVSIELNIGDSCCKPTYILKDADALDRIRFDDLDVSYLRFGESKNIVSLSEKLYYDNFSKKYSNFGHFLRNNINNIH